MRDMLASWLPAFARTSGKGLALPATISGLKRTLMQSPQMARRRWVHLFGWPGMVAAVLLVLCQMFYLSTIHPEQASLEAARKSAISMQQRLSRAAHGSAAGSLTPAEQLDEFYRTFPSDKDLLPLLEKIFKVARDQGISLDEGQYQVSQDRVGKLMRFQVILPVKSAYPQIRKFIDTLQAEIPVMAMENLQFERQKVGDPQVEAKIVLALYLEHKP